MGTGHNRLLEKYGNDPANTAELPRELRYGQTESYVEFARDGRLLKGDDNAVPKSRYEEDVMLNNHTSAWGSWYGLWINDTKCWCNIAFIFRYKNGEWGFACCHSQVRNSYCMGPPQVCARPHARSHVCTCV